MSKASCQRCGHSEHPTLRCDMCGTNRTYCYPMPAPAPSPPAAQEEHWRCGICDLALREWQQPCPSCGAAAVEPAPAPAPDAGREWRFEVGKPGDMHDEWAVSGDEWYCLEDAVEILNQQTAELTALRAGNAPDAGRECQHEVTARLKDVGQYGETTLTDWTWCSTCGSVSRQGVAGPESGFWSKPANGTPNLPAELTALRAENDRLDEACKRLGITIREQRQDNAALRARAETYKGMYTEAEGERDALEIEADAVRAEVESLTPGGSEFVMPNGWKNAIRFIRDRLDTTATIAKERNALRADREALRDAGVPTFLVCPDCGAAHVDKDEWATRPHRTHQCEHCGSQWRPFEVATYGVVEPGFEPDHEALEARARLADEARRFVQVLFQMGGVGTRFDSATQNWLTRYDALPQPALEQGTSTTTEDPDDKL